MKPPTETSTSEKPKRRLTLEQAALEEIQRRKDGQAPSKLQWKFNGVDVLDPKTTDEQAREAMHEALKATVKLPASDKNQL